MSTRQLLERDVLVSHLDELPYSPNKDGFNLPAWMLEEIIRHLSARPEVERKVVGYMNEKGGVMNYDDYHGYTDPAWRWVIDQHWTPVAPLYAGEFADRHPPQSSST